MTSFCNGALSPRRVYFPPGNEMSTRSRSNPPNGPPNSIISPIPPRLFKAELAALMGGDSANGSDTEDYQTLGSRHKSGVQSADTSPSHRPKQPSADQMPNFLANRVSNTFSPLDLKKPNSKLK